MSQFTTVSFLVCRLWLVTVRTARGGSVSEGHGPGRLGANKIASQDTNAID